MTERETDRHPTQKAIRACADWLDYCLSIGWSKGNLDALQELWWKHHDDEGKLA
jgi:hypothetical protein